MRTTRRGDAVKAGQPIGHHLSAGGEVLLRPGGECDDPYGPDWWGRLSAVYPGLQTEGESNEDGMNHDPDAMKRLLEDVAFAGADRTVPSIPIP